MNGILMVDKPAGWTSSDVVAKLRGVLHEKRIGHSGTLDPMATGLLVLFVGRATRAVQFAESHDKRYRAALRLGLVTDTQDITGTSIGGSPRDVTEGELETALATFRGPILQIPPMYSAIKVKGRKLYEIARRGGQAERQPRPVTIHELRLLGRDGADFLLDIRCSKGTYVRTLCHDIGQVLGCGGCMSALRRLEAGAFSLENAYTLEQIQQAANEGKAESLLLGTDTLFAEYPSLSIGQREEKVLRSGGVYPVPDAAEGVCRVYSASGEFLALGQVEKGACRSIKSFFEVR